MDEYNYTFTLRNVWSTEKKIFNIEYDLIALSVRHKKLRESNVWVDSLLSPPLPQYLETSDFIEANQIRDFYSKKLMMILLKGNELTPFRKELSSLVNSNGKTFDEKIIPLAFRLPEFYQYDCELNNIFNTTTDVVLGNDEYYFIKKLKKDNKGSKVFEYWFIDSNKNYVCITVDKKNPLIKLWNSIITQYSTSRVMTIHGTKLPVTRDGYTWFSIKDFILG